MAKDRDYIRARTAEQKHERIADILDVAEELLDERHYRELTMASIAGRLGYSRANLAHYVRSKEEILLLLYVRSLREMLDDMTTLTRDSLGKLPTNDAATAKHLAALVARHTDFGRIGTLLSSLIETNVSLECLTACKRDIMDMTLEAADLLVGCGLLRNREQALTFLVDLSNYVAGLYPAAHPLPIQREAATESGFVIPSYLDSLERYLAVQLAGYRSLR